MLELAGFAWDRQDIGESTRQSVLGVERGRDEAFQLVRLSQGVQLFFVDGSADVEWAGGDDGDEHLIGGNNSLFMKLGCDCSRRPMAALASAVIDEAVNRRMHGERISVPAEVIELFRRLDVIMLELGQGEPLLIETQREQLAGFLQL